MKPLLISLSVLLLTGCQSLDNAWSSSTERLGRVFGGSADEPAAAGQTAPATGSVAARRVARTDADTLVLTNYTVADQPYADEHHDYGTPPVSSLIPVNFRRPTPVTLAGGTPIATPALHTRMTSNDPPIVVNTLEGSTTELIPGSIWMSGAGRHGNFNDAVQQQLNEHLENLTGGDRNRMLVFYCTGHDCWSAYNASLRAVNMGYRNVRWYRGGLTAWYAAGLPSTTSNEDIW